MPQGKIFSVRKYALLFLLTTQGVWAGETITLDSLDRVIGLGFANNRGLLLENASLRIQWLQKNTRIRRFLPQLNAQISGRQRINYDTADVDERTLSFGVQQLLFDGFAFQREEERLKHEIRHAQLSMEIKRGEFLFQIIRSYFGFLESRERFDFQREFLKVQSNELAVVQRKYEIGEINKLEWLEWELSFREMKQETLELLAGFSNQLHQLVGVLGLSYDVHLDCRQRVRQELAVVNIDREKPSLIDHVLGQSLELKMLRSQIAMTKRNRTLRNQFLPDISLSIGYTTPFLRPFRQSDTWRVGMNVSFPFFFDQVSFSEDMEGTWGRFDPATRGSLSSTVLKDEGFITRIEKEKVDSASLLNEYEKTKNRLVFQTKSVLLDIDASYKRHILLRERLELLDMKLTIQKKKVELGELRPKEYLTSLHQYRAMQKQLIGNRFQYLSRVLELYKLEGLLKEERIMFLFQDFFVSREEDANATTVF